jgi:hypothetical protein
MNPAYEGGLKLLGGRVDFPWRKRKSPRTVYLKGIQNELIQVQKEPAKPLQTLRSNPV